VVHDVHGRRGGMRPSRRRRGFSSVADALRAARAAAVYLNSPAAGDLDGPARGEALEHLGAITSLLGADDGHDADGCAASAAWLAAKTRLGRRDARAAVRQMRLLGRHPLLGAATATGAVTISRAREIADHPGRGRADRRGPHAGVRRRGHRGAGGPGQAPRPGGLPQRRAAVPRRPAGGLRAADPHPSVLTSRPLAVRRTPSDCQRWPTDGLVIRSLVRVVRLVRRSPFPLVRIHRVSKQVTQIRCRFASP
jgi:hypothetical protein